MVVSQKEFKCLMRIVIDGRMYQQSGVGRYIRNLIFELQKLDKMNQYFILLTKPDYDRLEYHNKNFNKTLADFGWYGVKEQVELPKILNKLNPDLVHFPHFNVPIFYGGKFVVTIHDLIHQHFQMRRATTHDPITYKLKQIGYDKVFKNAINKSQKIITVSNFVKNDLCKSNLLPDGGKKVTVTYEAVEDKIITIVRKMSENKVNIILNKLPIKQPFIFYVGNAHPHKNVEGLIKTFLGLRRKYQYLQLVLSGQDHYFWQRVKKQYQHEGIIYTGFISDEELVALYKGARAFVLPSFEEGFGIPLLEAMACGCPVVASNMASLPEVGGEAVIYFDPRDVDDIVEKISQVLNSEKIRKDLIGKGLKRYKLFSWERMAKQTLEVYQNAGSNSP